MKDEIKEIINYVNNYRYNKECKNLVVEDVLTIEEAYKLIDCIINSQEENEKLQKEAEKLQRENNVLRSLLPNNEEFYFGVR